MAHHFPESCGAKVRILNISPRYRENMALDAGSYNVEVSAGGYETKRQWVELEAGDYLDIDINLQKVKTAQSRSFSEPVTDMDFVHIPEGCFQMGSTDGDSDEKPVHEVCVDDFYMGKYEVTVGQWRKFIRDSKYTMDAEKDRGGKKGCYSYKDGKWSWRSGHNWDNLGFSQSAKQPVACVSHNDVSAFIRWLNRQGSKEFRLPTEAEWEYAARGGTCTIRYWGDDPDNACRYANVRNKKYWSNGFSCDDGYKFSSPVGGFKPNRYGLYDMLGNVREWCSDRYDSKYYTSSPRNNPQGPSSGSYRVARGGSWFNRPARVRAAIRGRDGAAGRDDFMGFRLVSSGQ